MVSLLFHFFVMGWLEYAVGEEGSLASFAFLGYLVLVLSVGMVRQFAVLPVEFLVYVFVV